MKKSATEVMQEIMVSAAIDAVMALKAASKGLPNNLLRDLNAIHANTTAADLPPELQQAITAGVRSAFSRLLKEGYSVSPGRPEPSRDPRPRPGGPGGAGRPNRRPPGKPGEGRGPRREGPGPRDGQRPSGPRPPRKPGLRPR
jgi:hypothetical protein